MKRTLIIALIFCIKAPTISQDYDFNIQAFIESVFNNQEETLNYDEFYEQLLLLYENPIELNAASAEDLQSLYLLSANQIKSFIDFRSENGLLLTIYELIYIEGFDYQLVKQLLPFVTLDSEIGSKESRPLLKRVFTAPNSYVIVRYERTLQERKGFTEPESPADNRYLGSPAKAYMRYRAAKANDFSLGLTLEKDAGEQINWNPSKNQFGVDYWSAHFMLEKRGNWQKIIVGDYQLQFGQGLIFGSGLGVGKGAETINALERAQLGIRPYTSVLESGFLRGLATAYDISSKLRLTTFLSRMKQDASIQTSDTDDFQNYFSSIRYSGLHRTVSELGNKDQITESVIGANIHFKPNELRQIGIVLTANRFSLPLIRADKPYNRFEFKGRSNLNLSIYGSSYWKQFRFFGEGGISKSGGMGVVIGFTTKLSRRLEMSMLARDYQRNFHAFRGTSFAEGSRNINESGVYTGLKYTYNKSLFITAYYDLFRSPWLRFRVNRPSVGQDYFIRFNYKMNSRTFIYLQYRKKSKEQNSSIIVNNTLSVRQGVSNQYIFNLQFEPTNHLTLKSRVQFSDYSLGVEKNDGFAIVQDVIFKPTSLIILSGRIALFDTEGSRNRQYVYERDVLYAFSIPAYSGRGIRNYLLIQYRPHRRFDLWFRLSRTNYYDREEIGTGLETIQGNKRTDLKVQIRYKLT